MAVVIENYIFNNLSCFLHTCLRIYVTSSLLSRSLIRLCSIIAKGPMSAGGLLKIFGKASSLEKNYPSIY